MSYTPEEVIRAANAVDSVLDDHRSEYRVPQDAADATDMLRAYAATLRQSADSGRAEAEFFNRLSQNFSSEHLDLINTLWRAAGLGKSDSGRVGDEGRLLQRAYEVVHHEHACPAIGGAGDTDCRCDAVPFLRALEAALAAQGQGEIDLRKYVRHLADVLEAGVGMWKVDADLQRLAAAINANLPAPAASHAGVPDGYVLVPLEPTDTDAFMVLHEYQQLARTRKDAYRIAIRRLAERASERLAAAPSAPEGEGGEG